MTNIEKCVFPVTGDAVRTVVLDGVPWFVASDVTAILGYADGRHAVNGLPAHMRNTVPISHGTPGNPNRAVVTESGVYRLVMRSNLPAAEAFQNWLAEDVIPAIRRTGSYCLAPRPVLPQSYAEALRALADSVEERDAAQAALAVAAPKAEAWEVLASADGDYAVRDAAKIVSRDAEVSIGERRLFTALAEWGWVFRGRADGRWRAAQSAVDSGWLAELPQSRVHPESGELLLAAPQVRITVTGLARIRTRLGVKAVTA